MGLTAAVPHYALELKPPAHYDAALEMNLRPTACLLVPAAVAIVSLSILGIFALDGWPGTTGVTAGTFCEAFRQGTIKQPANTWSNLGFLSVGLIIGWYAWWRGAESGPNRMRSTVLYPLMYASIVTFLCPGSMAMHASTTSWGGKVDVFSMHLWVAFALVYGLGRLLTLSTRSLLAGYLVLVLGLGGSLFLPISGSLVFGIVLASYALVEAAIFLKPQALVADRRWLIAAAILFLVAFAIWIPSRTGGPLCDPQSLLQGHAIWHLLDALALGCLYVFYRSEEAAEAVRTSQRR
jgi:hypothetical protein